MCTSININGFAEHNWGSRGEKGTILQPLYEGEGHVLSRNIWTPEIFVPPGTNISTFARNK